MDEVTLEETDEGWSYTCPPVEGDPNAVSGELLLASGHLVATMIYGVIGNDYDRRSRVSVQLHNGGRSYRITITSVGKTPPTTEELNRGLRAGIRMNVVALGAIAQEQLVSTLKGALLQELST